MEDLHSIMAALGGTFTSLWTFLLWMLNVSRESGVEPSVAKIIAILALAIFWLGSGFIAATIAEARARKRFLHLAGGLLLPLLYPFAILIFMPRASYDRTPEEKAKEKERQLQAEQEAKGPSAAELAQQQTAATEDQTDKLPLLPQEQPKPRIAIARGPIGEAAAKPAAPAPASLLSTDTHSFGAPVASGIPRQFNQKHFANISTDENGNFRGPFMIETSDSRFLEALRISQALPEVLVVEIQAEGGKIRSVRLPYSKVTDCKLKSEWMGHDPHAHS